MTKLSTKTEIFNAYVALGGTKAITSFNSKEKLLAALEVLETAAAAKKAAESKTTKAPKAKAEKADRKVSVSSRCQQLIREGKSNAEVWAIIQPEFGLDDSKKHYPSWNASMMKRKGLI